MSVFKSYFSKNNTIVSNSKTNTSKNPVSEIFYGGFYSRMLLHIDLTDLQNRISQGYINRDSIQKHILKLTNTINPTDSSFFGGENGFGVKRDTSFDLVFFKLTEQWDEGVGYDYTDTSFKYPTQNTYSDGPSNWYKRTTINDWSTEGAKELGTVIGTQHFDNGDENIEVDITSYINSVLDGNETHFGIGISYDEPYENIDTLTYHRSVAFFSKYTQTFFEPYLETVFDDHFVDNRNDFYVGVSRNLILYVNQANEPVNLDTNPTVDIFNGNTLLFEDLETIHVTKGIYKVTFTVDPQSCKTPLILNDVWKGLSINGYEVPVVTQEFTLRSNTEFFNVGIDELNPSDYSYSFMGLNRDEKIVSGDVRKVYVDIKVPFTYHDTIQVDNLRYKLYVKEGNTTIDVIDWTDINRAYNSNYFLLDTSMLIANKEYYLDLQLVTNREINTYKKEISFYVVNKK